MKIIPANPDSRFNDGKVYPGGGFRAGTMGPGAVQKLYRLDGSHTLCVLEGGITISDGIGWSPDHIKMYYTNTPTGRINVYDYDLQTGDIHNRRCFASILAEDGVPDGLTVDEQGFVWSACWVGGR